MSPIRSGSPRDDGPAALLLRHMLRLAAELVAYGRLNRAWWILPTVALLIAVVLIGTATQAAVPYAVYTLF